MKARSKRYAAILSVVTVLAMALSLVAVPAPSFAAAATTRTSAFPDVPANAPYATAFNVLAALGVYQGDQSGNANPSQQITRAEAAAVAVRLAGYASTAAALQNQTPSFKDAAQIPSWAWGAINAATTLGIINGYPDGTFRANNPVTQAEMLAMITRVLGNQGGVVGPWPTNYVAYATQAGLLNGISNPSANIPATRADVAFMAYNALGVTKKWDSATSSFDKDFAGLPLTYVDSNGQTQPVKNPTSFAAAKGWVVTGTVQSASPTSVTIVTTTGKTVTLSLASVVNVSGAADLAGLINQTVSFYGNTTDSSGNVIVAAAVPSATQSVTSGAVNDFSLANKDIEIGSTYYGLATDASGNVATTFTVNGSVTTGTYFSNFYSSLKKGPMNATVTLDANNHVTAVSAWAPTDVAMISSVSVASNSASNNTIKLAQESNAYVVDNAILTLDGKAASINDLSTAQSNFQTKYGSSYGALAVVYTPLGSNGQLITPASGNVTAARVDVYDTVVTGTVQGYGTDSNGSYVVVNVSGTNQTLYKSSLSGAALPGSPAQPSNLNSSVSLLQDGSGKVYVSLTPVSTVQATVAALAGTSVTYSSTGNSTTATFTMPDGSSATTSSSAYASLSPVGGAFYLHFSSGSIDSVQNIVYAPSSTSGLTNPIDLKSVNSATPSAIGNTGLSAFTGTFGGVSGNVVTINSRAYPVASKALVYDSTADLNSGTQGAFSDLSNGTSVIAVEDNTGYVVLVVALPTPAQAPTASSISLDTTSLALQVNETHQLKVTATFSDGSTKDVTSDPNTQYTPDNGAIVSVSNGLVTGLLPGQTKITVKYGGQSATVTVTVSGAVMRGVTANADGTVSGYVYLGPNTTAQVRLYDQFNTLVDYYDVSQNGEQFTLGPVGGGIYTVALYVNGSQVQSQLVKVTGQAVQMGLSNVESQPGTRTVSGVATVAPGMPATVELVNASTGQLVSGDTLQYTVSGTYPFTFTSVPPGDYEVVFLLTQGLVEVQTVPVHVSAGAAAKVNVTTESSSVQAGTPDKVTVTVYDANNDPVQGAQVDFTVSDTTYASVSPASGTTDGNGQVTVTFTGTKAETVTVTATVHGTSVNGQTSITVEPGQFSQLLFDPNPINNGTPSGGAYTITLTAADSYGNAVTTVSSVYLAITGAGSVTVSAGTYSAADGWQLVSLSSGTVQITYTPAGSGSVDTIMARDSVTSPKVTGQDTYTYP